MGAACRAARRIQLYLEFQASKQAQAQQLAQMFPGAPAGRAAATDPTGGGARTVAPSYSSKQQQQQQPKPGTIQAMWGYAAAAVKKLSPLKSSRADVEPDTQQLQQPVQQSSKDRAQRLKPQPSAEDAQQSDAAKQQQGAGVQQQGLQQPRGPWDPEGFAWRKLDSKFVAQVFNETGEERRQLQAIMMEAEAAGGHVSLDHVHETAKRMQGGFTGMLIAMSALGTVLGYWHVYSTSLQDVERQLKDLNKRQLIQHGEVGAGETYRSAAARQTL
jgi:hypothetical protein